MPVFTIETTCHPPVYRHRTYEADAVEQACQLAIEDDDWSDERLDYDSTAEPIRAGARDPSEPGTAGFDAAQPTTPDSIRAMSACREPSRIAPPT